MFKGLKKKEEAKKLIAKGHFDLARKQYGKRIYKNALIDLTYNEIKEAKGKKAAIRYKIENLLRFTTLNTLSFLTSGYLAMQGLTLYGITARKQYNSVKFEKEIEDYNTKLDEKAEYFSSFELTDLELMMAITIDMYENTEGYGYNEDEIDGFLGASMTNGENPHGVCRNMAYYGVDLINKIAKKTGKKYNARVLCGKADFENLELADSSILKTRKQEENENEEGNFIPIFSFDVSADHDVIALDVEDGRLPIIWDITNTFYAQRGERNQIKSFNNKNKFKEDGTIEVNEFVTFISAGDGFDPIPHIVEDFFYGSNDTGFTDEEIKNMYGIEAQRQAINNWREKKKEYEKNKFKSNLKLAKIELNNETNDNQKKKSVNKDDSFIK